MTEQEYKSKFSIQRSPWYLLAFFLLTWSVWWTPFSFAWQLRLDFASRVVAMVLLIWLGARAGKANFRKQ